MPFSSGAQLGRRALSYPADEPGDAAAMWNRLQPFTERWETILPYLEVRP